MEHRAITIGGLAAIEGRKIASIAMLNFCPKKPSQSAHFGAENSALSYAPTRAEYGIQERNTKVTVRMPDAGIEAGRTINGSTLLSVETPRNAKNAEQKTLNSMPTTLNRIRIFLNSDLMSQMESHFALNVIGTSILHKMKRRLIRWNPERIYPRAIPSLACRETCLKV